MSHVCSVLFALTVGMLGPRDGGGGGEVIQESTEKQVVFELQGLQNNLEKNLNKVTSSVTFKWDYLFESDAWFMANPELKKLFTDLIVQDTKGDTLLMRLAKSAQIVINRGDACKDLDGNETDASVDSFTMGSHICFSVQRLRRISPESLNIQLTALFLHELSHQAGYGEATALKFQRYMLYQYFPIQPGQQTNFSEYRLNINRSGRYFSWGVNFAIERGYTSDTMIGETTAVIENVMNGVRLYYDDLGMDPIGVHGLLGEITAFQSDWETAIGNIGRKTKLDQREIAELTVYRDRWITLYGRLADAIAADLDTLL